MREDAPEYFSTNKAKRNLMVAAFLAPITFLTQQLVKYIFVPWACNRAGMIPIYCMSAGSMLVCALAVWMSWRFWKQAGQEMTWELGGSIGRSRFIGFVAMLFSGLFLLATLASSIPDWIMSPCHP